MASEDLEALVAGLERVTASPDLQAQIAADLKLRDRFSEACRYGMLKVERPWDTLHRLVFPAFEVPIAVVGNNVGLWKAINEAGPDGRSVTKLAKTTGIEDTLLLELLRYAAAHGMCDQVDESTFAASNISRTLAMDGMRGGMNINRECFEPVANKLPEYLASLNYKRPTKLSEGGFAFVHGTGTYDFWAQNPRQAKDFNALMGFQREGLQSWLDVVPLEKYVDAQPTTDRIQFVDVAGGQGHQALSVLHKFPALKDRVMLQDRPDMNALETAQALGLVVQGMDFFQANPTPGARVYYLRGILHNWNDDDCVRILRHLKDALAPDSVILVDDLVVPAVDRYWYSSTFDLTMAICLAAKERSEADFRGLYDAVGLRCADAFALDAYGSTVQVLVRQ